MLLFLGAFVIVANSQTSSNMSIYLAPGGNFYETYFPFNPTSCNDTIKEVISDDEYFICYLKDCKGAMHFEAYKNNCLVIEGDYVNSIDTFKHCVVVNDGHDPDQPFIVVSQEYLQPLKNGSWRYYSSKGRLIKQEAWNDGILVPVKSSR
jgi:hypothetical protein